MTKAIGSESHLSWKGSLRQNESEFFVQVVGHPAVDGVPDDDGDDDHRRSTKMTLPTFGQNQNLFLK